MDCFTRDLIRGNMANEREENDRRAAFIERASMAIRGSADDLREKGFAVAVHNDYRHDGHKWTFWLMTIKVGDRVHAYRGEAKTDAEALDFIRAEYARDTDALHHAPACPANHYHGKRAPTGRCTCGAAAIAKSR